METGPKREGGEVARSNLTIGDAIRELAAHNARAGLDDEYQLLLFLQSWWSRTYNRPLKDPVLASYTLEELLYEFYDRIERQKAYEEQIEKESDTIERKKDQEASDWADEEEKREKMEETASMSSNSESEMIEQSVEEYDPTQDPDNMRWMEEQIQKSKQMHGESFGEDIETNFEE